MSYVNLDTIQRPVNEGTLDPDWGDTVNDNLNYLFAQVTALLSGQSAAMPVGAVLAYAGALTAPNAGWLVCNGSAVSRSTFSALFNNIGTQYGAGDGSTTFNLPDARSAMLLGAASSSPSGLTVRALAARGGGETHALSIGELASHGHTVTDSGHGHGTNNASHNHGTTEATHSHTPAAQTVVTAASTLALAVSATAGTSVVGTVPTQVAIDVGQAFNSGLTSTGLSINTNTTGLTISTGSGGVTLANTGSGTPMTLMNPFLALNFIIKCS
jgi:microcystin-dependent protein